MDTWKAVIGSIIVLVLLVVLYPRRQLASAPDANIVEITYMGPGGPLSGTVADLVREFERQSELAHKQDPSKPIYRVISGQTAARDQVADPTRFLVSVAGGSPPDVIMFDRYAVAEWAARGGFTPLDSFIERDIAAGRDTPTRDQFFPAAWEEAMYDGKIYGIPMSIDNRALMFNRDAMRRAGLVDADGNVTPPRTWDELRTAVRKLTIVQRRSDGVQMTLEQWFEQTPSAKQPDGRFVLDTRLAELKTVGFIPMYGNSWLYMFGWMNGGEFMSDDGKRVTLNAREIVEALEWVKEIYDEMGGYAAVQSFQAGFQGGALDPFISGRVAMKIDGYWQMNHLGQFARDVDFGIDTPPMPQHMIDRGVDKISWTGGWAYAIPATARQKEGAWELIRFLLSDRAIQMQARADKQLADSEGRLYFGTQHPKIAMNEWVARTFVYDNPTVGQKYRDGVRMFNDLLPYSRFRPTTPVGQLLWNEHVTKTETALYGRKPAQVALDEGNAVVQRELDRFVNPTPGTPIRSWAWFLAIYGLVVVAIGAVVVLFDTRLGVRRAIGGWLGMSSAARESVVAGSNGSYMRSQWFGGFVCVAPWLLGFLIFGGGPMLFSLVISFCRYDIINPAEFVGIDNYRRMLFDDELIAKSLWNTIYMVIGIPLGMAASLGIALLLNQGVKGMAAWRTMFYLPAIVPAVAMSLLWIWLLNPQAGLVNRALGLIGIEGPMWLQSEVWSKPSIIFMGLWAAGGGMIIWLAGLKGISTSLYEAAAVDGAGPIRQFFHVTIPQLTPYIFFNLIMGLIGTFQIFGEAFIMTQGGPVNSTLFYVYHLFNNAFRYGQMGYASAMAWLLFAIVLVLTIVQLKLSKRWVHYESD